MLFCLPSMIPMYQIPLVSNHLIVLRLIVLDAVVALVPVMVPVMVLVMVPVMTPIMVPILVPVMLGDCWGDRSRRKCRRRRLLLGEGRLLVQWCNRLVVAQISSEGRIGVMVRFESRRLG